MYSCICFSHAMPCRDSDYFWDSAGLKCCLAVRNGMLAGKKITTHFIVLLTYPGEFQIKFTIIEIFFLQVFVEYNNST